MCKMKFGTLCCVGVFDVLRAWLPSFCSFLFILDFTRSVEFLFIFLHSDWIRTDVLFIKLCPNHDIYCMLQVAKLVTFLASNDAAMVTGSVYLMDGGWSVKA